MRVTLWSVAESGPARLDQGHTFAEADLEGWIEKDPTLVLEGLRWIGRQVILPDRSRLDLVGLTREGQIVVTELSELRLETAASVVMGRNLGPADLNRVALVVHQRLGGSIRLSDLYPDRSSGSWVAVERVPEERGQARRQRKAARNRKARTGDGDNSKGEMLVQRVDSRISTQLV